MASPAHHHRTRGNSARLDSLPPQRPFPASGDKAPDRRLVVEATPDDTRLRVVRERTVVQVLKPAGADGESPPPTRLSDEPRPDSKHAIPSAHAALDRILPPSESRDDMPGCLRRIYAHALSERLKPQDVRALAMCHVASRAPEGDAAHMACLRRIASIPPASPEEIQRRVAPMEHAGVLVEMMIGAATALAKDSAESALSGEWLGHIGLAFFGQESGQGAGPLAAAEPALRYLSGAILADLPASSTRSFLQPLVPLANPSTSNFPNGVGVQDMINILVSGFVDTATGAPLHAHLATAVDFALQLRPEFHLACLQAVPCFRRWSVTPDAKRAPRPLDVSPRVLRTLGTLAQLSSARELRPGQLGRVALAALVSEDLERRHGAKVFEPGFSGTEEDASLERLSLASFLGAKIAAPRKARMLAAVLKAGKDLPGVSSFRLTLARELMDVARHSTDTAALVAMGAALAEGDAGMALDTLSRDDKKNAAATKPVPPRVLDALRHGAELAARPLHVLDLDGTSPLNADGDSRRSLLDTLLSLQAPLPPSRSKDMFTQVLASSLSHDEKAQTVQVILRHAGPEAGRTLHALLSPPKHPSPTPLEGPGPDRTDMDTGD